MMMHHTEKIIREVFYLVKKAQYFLTETANERPGFSLFIYDINYQNGGLLVSPLFK